MSNMPDQLAVATNPTYVYIHAFVDELQRAHVDNVVICPGSRSTPLALVLAEHPDIHVWMHLDERSAAFFALGMAKHLQQTVALLCTSGTAAANFLPAVAEAKLTHVPLLVLTADRPHELRDCGAPQAIDQNRLYGTHVKWFVDVALPEASNRALRSIRTIAQRAVALTRAVPAGPVHLNFPLREPLTPEPLNDQPLPPSARRDTDAWEGLPANAAYVAVSDAALGSALPTTITHIAELVRTIPHGLIIAGPQDNPALTEPLLQLAERLGYPILADPLSQLRCGNHEQQHIIASYDAFLRVEAFITQTEPQLVLRFGAMPTSKPLLLYLKRYSAYPQIVVDGQGGWEEPTQLATAMVHADPTAFCQDLLAAVARATTGTTSQAARQQLWLTTWQHTDLVTQQALQTTIQDFQPIFEGRVFTELAELLPDGATLYVGNSMPVRDMDTFFWGNQRHIRILGNRGANGIDGMISSALGASATADKSTSTVLVIGDLSFFHDLNGLLAARLHQLNLTIILINNDGGGIFSFLPQAAYSEHFEQLFGTPTGLDFRLVVQMYGGQFQSTETWETFRNALERAITARGLQVIELRTERASNVTLHRQLWQTVEQALIE